MVRATATPSPQPLSSIVKQAAFECQRNIHTFRFSGYFIFYLPPLADVAGAYDQNTAIDSVFLSAAAYCNASAINAWSCGACNRISLRSVKAIEYPGYNLQAYVGQRSNGVLCVGVADWIFRRLVLARDGWWRLFMHVTGEIVVGFRGTQPSSLKNWIEDLKSAEHVAYPFSGCSGCRTAKGFTESYAALRGDILNHLDALGGKSHPVTVTGHSLGAAMAGVCAFDLKQQGFTVNPVYTFGQPRVGDSTFFNAFQQSFPSGSYFRVTHYKDIVPHLPFTIMSYHHMSTEVWYAEDNLSYRVCNGSGEDPSCSDSVFGDSISDHLHYVGYPISNMC